MIKHANTVKEFDELVAGKTAVVDFFATWCGPCKMLSPVIEQVDAKGLVPCDFVKVDVDEVEELAMRYGIQTIPTIIIFKDGKAVSVLRGFMPEQALVAKINEALA